MRRDGDTKPRAGWLSCMPRCYAAVVPCPSQETPCTRLCLSVLNLRTPPLSHTHAHTHRFTPPTHSRPNSGPHALLLPVLLSTLPRPRQDEHSTRPITHRHDMSTQRLLIPQFLTNHDARFGPHLGRDGGEWRRFLLQLSSQGKLRGSRMQLGPLAYA